MYYSVLSPSAYIVLVCSCFSLLFNFLNFLYLVFYLTSSQTLEADNMVENEVYILDVVEY